MLDKTVAVTFAGTEIHENLQDEFYDLYADKFHAVELYCFDWLRWTDFYEENPQVFKYDKYCGYFLWKPYIIRDAMQRYGDDYNYLYCDSNVRFKDFDAFESIYNKTLVKNKGYFFVKCKNFQNYAWTKRDAFVYLNADTSDYWNSNQLWTSLMGFKATASPKAFLYQLEQYCKIPGLVNDDDNVLGLPNIDGFVAHRWEQSITSIMFKMRELDGIWDEGFIGSVVDKIYPQELMDQKKKGL